MKRAFDVRQLIGGFVEEIAEDAAHDGLMADDEDVFLPVQLHDDGLQPRDQVLIRFAPRIPIVILILISLGEILRKLLLNLLVGHLVTDASVDFVEGFPRFLRCVNV